MWESKTKLFLSPCLWPNSSELREQNQNVDLFFSFTLQCSKINQEKYEKCKVHKMAGLFIPIFRDDFQRTYLHLIPPK